ncbi:DUF4189 domain-containing protein [Altererythrobacter sp. Z27]|uniref:DUF4189 domain-containing protein n=1 Tax=Altererythrobacter sp. Z27 TaxID=3461147 RepID=UPI004043FD99
MTSWTFGLRLISACLVTTAAMALWPKDAAAQRCPAGIPGQGNPGCIPPDVYAGNQGGQNHSSQVDDSAPLHLSWQAGHSALVWHPDATEVWAVWNAADLSEATGKALDACNKVMGDGCVVAVSSTGGTIAFGFGPDGYARAVWGNKKRDAVKKFNEQCALTAGNCRLAETITSTHIKRPVMVPILRTRSYLPNTRGAAAYGAVASPKTDPVGTKWQGHAWLVTGAPTYAAATDKAIMRCKVATGMDCGIDAHGVNSNIFLYTSQDDYFFWGVELTRQDAEASMPKRCKNHSKGKRCVITAFFDLQTPRDEVVTMSYTP